MLVAELWKDQPLSGEFCTALQHPETRMNDTFINQMLSDQTAIE